METHGGEGQPDKASPLRDKDCWPGSLIFVPLNPPGRGPVSLHLAGIESTPVCPGRHPVRVPLPIWLGIAPPLFPESPGQAIPPRALRDRARTIDLARVRGGLVLRLRIFLPTPPRDLLVHALPLLRAAAGLHGSQLSEEGRGDTG